METVNWNDHDFDFFFYRLGIFLSSPTANQSKLTLLQSPYKDSRPNLCLCVRDKTDRDEQKDIKRAMREEKRSQRVVTRLQT